MLKDPYAKIPLWKEKPIPPMSHFTHTEYYDPDTEQVVVDLKTVIETDEDVWACTYSINIAKKAIEEFYDDIEPKIQQRLDVELGEAQCIKGHNAPKETMQELIRRYTFDKKSMMKDIMVIVDKGPDGIPDKPKPASKSGSWGGGWGRPPAEFYEKYPCLTQRVACPDCPGDSMHDTMEHIIIHLNDNHKWTREAVADWIRLLDASGVIDSKEKVT